MVNDQKSKWSNKDWVWTVGILVMIIILLIADFFNYPNIEANFSIISSAVSIALALVAIFIALKQDSDNQELANQMNETLIKVELKIDSMDQKVEKLDPSYVNSLVKSKTDDITEIIDKAGESNLSMEDIKIIIADEMGNLKEEINRKSDMESLVSNNENYLRYTLTPLVFKRLMNIIVESEQALTRKDIYKKYADKYGNIPPDHFMNPILEDVVKKEGFIKENKIINDRVYTYYKK
ncbi:hypothetical protein FKQ51_20095 [Bacillus toyonensis]|uniref:hypothetical protein n=1 Tax=Bacillus toyonensis TaxID=155322 RepID=UPI002704C81C|nr:hypothetical protein [Bacillus toyonensis]MDO8159613.1 hypothetical protein [Bacillus toyonensis]